MAEIRCPMCGKSNPDNLEVCQHCQARLKPLTISPSESPEGSKPELPDWQAPENEAESPFEDQERGTDLLARLNIEGDSDNQDEPPPEIDSDATAEPEGDQWLRRLRDQSTDDDTQEEQEDASAVLFDGEIPDWMAEEQAEEKRPPTTDASPAADDGIPEWLKSPQEPTFDFSDEPAEEEIALPDWHATDAESPKSELPATEPVDDNLFDRIADEKQDDSSEDGEPGQLDWLQSLAAESPQVSEISAEDSDSKSELESDLPDWFEAPKTETAPESAKTSADLTDLSGETEDDLPDWMDESPKTPDVSADPSELSPETEAELPDWVAAPKTEETSPGMTGLPIDADDDLPDWMETLEIDEPPEIPDISADLSELSPESEAELPDWLETPKVEASAEIPEDPSDSDGIPDWLSGIEDDDIEIPIILPDPEPETPEWISGEDAAELSWPPEKDSSPPGGEIEPDWLDNLPGDQIPELPDFSPSDDAFDTELLAEDEDEELFGIEGLSDLFNDEDDEQLTESGAETSDDLAPADLPGWLEAMRPVDTAEGLKEERKGAKVKTGPLAGLSGVLNAEPEIARLKKSTAHTSKLQVSEFQQNQVKLLRDIIEIEGKPIPIHQRAEITSRSVFRWLYAFILIFVVGIVVFSESQTVSPIPPTDALIDTSKLINSVTSRDAVLVSFDYEPGMAGEMEAAAAAVVDHLMIKGAYLTLISTSPTGPALAERFIANVQSEHNYVSGNQYINLGYIPGGAAGLLGFVQMPQRITPLSFDGMDAWATAPLMGINTLSDYKLVLVLTDNPDSARMWIEQVQPRLLETPLIAVASAQAEPILKPYADGDNPQIQGLIGSIIDGAAYEQITGRPKLAREYWDALNYALLTAIGAIFLGGIANIVSILFRKKPREVAE